MFENLRNAMHEAFENFQRELDRDRLPESVDELLHWMEDEIVDARVRVRALGDERARSLAEAATERESAATCRRRGELAARIGDDETVRLAEEHAVRHERRADVLRGKADALAAEIELHEGEVKQMVSTFKEARANKPALAARLGRARADHTVRSADALFDELDQMDERTSDFEVEVDAAGDLDVELGHDGGARSSFDRTGLTDEEADAALEELKRRMGR